MLAVVTGATGLLGGNLALELVKEGHDVRATRRRSSRVDHLDGCRIEWVEADLADQRALQGAFADADVVFHCAAAVSIRRTATEALVATNLEGTQRVVGAVRAARVARMIHCSTAGAVGVSEDGRPCTEDARWNFHEYGLDNGYVTTKRRAEECVGDAVHSGLDVVIVNPTYMLGPYDARPSSGQLIIDVVRGRLPGYLPGFNNFVDVRDVARGMIAAWQKGIAGERYILGGENLSYRAVAELICSSAGIDPLRWQIPAPVARLIGFAGDVLEWIGLEPLLNSTTVRYGFTERFQFSSEKARADLGYRHGSVQTAIADAVAWFRQRKMI